MHGYPFTAIVGQKAMKRALVLHAVDPRLGGLLILGERGTGKSTAVRALAELLPPINMIPGCPFHCDPERPDSHCERCSELSETERRVESTDTPVVDLPLGATEDRVLGSLDLDAALGRGERRFQPGLLAHAHRGFLYIDEVNLLSDHLVDLLLDVAASGENIVEREGFSLKHPAEFVLVGSGNPEEGEVRPQLLDRFALSVSVTTLTDVESRTEVLRRRLEHSDDPAAFAEHWQPQQDRLRTQIRGARRRLQSVRITDSILELVAHIGRVGKVDGHRAELALIRAARAHASLEGRPCVTDEDIRQTALLALAHRRPEHAPELERQIDEAVNAWSARV